MSELASKDFLGGACEVCTHVPNLHESLNSLHKLVQYLTEKNYALYGQISDLQRENEQLKLFLRCQGVNVEKICGNGNRVLSSTFQVTSTGPQQNNLQVDKVFDEYHEREILRLRAFVGLQKETIRYLHEQTSSLD